jgi:imidazolonepropionase-like amidohydrolase
MKKPYVLIVIFLSIFLNSFAQQFAPDVAAYIKISASTFAITHVKIIDGTGNPAVADQTVIVTNGKIERVGAFNKVKLRAGINTIDGTGKTLTPGLVMVHEHLFYTIMAGSHFNIAEMPWSFPRLYLAGGATTIRTGGSIEPQTDLNLKRMINEGKMIGPNMDVTAPYFEEISNYDIPSLNTISGPKDAAATANFWADHGCTSFKVYVHATRADMAAVITEAHKRNLKVTGHIGAVTYREAADMGIDNLEHGFEASSDFDSLKVPDKINDYTQKMSLIKLQLKSDKMKDLMQHLISKHVALTSTLPVFEPFTGREVFPGDAGVALITEVKGPIEKLYQAVQGKDAAGAAFFKKELAWEKQFYDMGGLLLGGSDPTGSGRVIAGYSNHREIELLVEAGFIAEQAIKICTLNGAVYLGREKEIGTIAVGKNADLVLIDGDITSDIKNIRKTELVFKNGVGFDSQKIFESVKGHVGMN